VPGFWSADRLPRSVTDRGITRALKLAVRTAYPGEVELGVFAVLTEDRDIILVCFSHDRRRAVSLDVVGIECRASRLCPSATLTSEDGVNGEVADVFRNRDVVVNDLMKDITLVPRGSQPK